MGRLTALISMGALMIGWSLTRLGLRVKSEVELHSLEIYLRKPIFKLPDFISMTGLTTITRLQLRYRRYVVVLDDHFATAFGLFPPREKSGFSLPAIVDYLSSSSSSNPFSCQFVFC